MPADFRPVPAIPAIPADAPQNLRPLLTALRDGAQVRFGQSRNKLDRNVTVRELMDLGLLTSQNAGARVSLGTAISDAIKENTGQPTQGVLPNISTVNFSVNTLGVVIDWAYVYGLDYNTIAAAEIWRSNAFVPLADGSYPAMAISAIGVDPPTLAWVNPAAAAAAVDKNGNPLPNPTVALSGIASGFIYSEYILPGTHYFYWVRYRGYNDSYSGWHALNGSRVDAVPDWQNILDALEGELNLVHLSSTLADKIVSIDDLEDGLLAEINYRQNAIAGEATARALAITNESNARIAAISNEAAIRANAILAETNARIIAINDAIEDEVTARDLAITFATAALVDAIADESSARATAIANEQTARINALIAEANARTTAISNEATTRENRVLDAFAHTNARELVINGYIDQQVMLQNAAIENYSEIFTTADEALAVQVNAMIAASGIWFVQAAAPPINPLWDGTYHWIETDNTNKHWVSTDDVSSRPVITNVLPSPATLINNFTAQGGGVYEKTAGNIGTLRFEDVPAGTYIFCFDTLVTTPGNFTFYANNVAIGSSNTKTGTYERTFTLTGTADIEIRTSTVLAALFSRISLRPSTEAMTWVDVTDTRISSTAAALATEISTRNTQFGAQATINNNLTAQINAPVTGLIARANAMDTFQTYVLDQGASGFLSQASKFTALESSAATTATNSGNTATALQNLTTYLNNTGPTGYIQQSLFGTALGTSLANSLNGVLATNSALSALETYINNQGANGLLLSSSNFTSLKSAVEDPTTGTVANATALSDLTTYVNNQGAGGLLLSSSQFTNLKTVADNAAAGVTTNANAISSLTTYINNQGAGGFLLSSSQFTNLKTVADNAAAGVTTNTNAISGLTTYINNQGAGGFLQSASRFTTLEAQYGTLTGYIDAEIAEEASARNTQFGPVATTVASLNAQVNTAGTGLVARATALESHKAYVLDQGDGGFLAGASRFASLKTLADNTAASLTSEVNLRASQFTSQTTINNTVSGQINNPTTGLLARATALESFKTYVLDQGASGFLAESSRIIALTSTANNASTIAGSASTAVQNLTTYLNNTGPTGYIQQSLFSTALGTALANSMTGVLATNSALSALETYVNDQGPAGFLANASRITTLTTNTTNAQNTATQAVNAVDSLTTYVNNQGAGGFLQSATRFTSLESSFADLEDDYAVSSSVLQTLDSFVRDTGPTGFIATSSTLTTLIANAVSTRATVSQMNSAISSASQASANLVTQLETKLQDPNQSVIYQQAAALIATVEGKLEGRITNKLDINGRITGYEFWDSANDQYTSTSSFIISANTFQIRNPITGSIPLSISGSAINLNFDVMTLSGVIPNANIGTIDVGKITGNTANFVSANIGNGTITAAKIADSLQSNNFNLFAGTGWYIGKDGTLLLNNVNARGNIEATSLKVDSANIVKTLHLQGNAVTIPGAILHTSPMTFFNGASYVNQWFNILELAMAPAGEIIPYHLQIYLRGLARIDAPPSSIRKCQLQYRLRIDYVAQPTQVIQTLIHKASTGYRKQWGDYGGPGEEEPEHLTLFKVAIPALVQSGGSVFSVDMRISTDGTGLGSGLVPDEAILYLAERGMTVTGFRR